MALIILEGLDKTGKSTVAEHFRQKQRYEYIHMTAPAKWHNRDSYFAEMLHLIAITAGKNVVMDRSWFGELVWPDIFVRPPKLTYLDCDILTAVAVQLHGDVQTIYMHDPNREAHLARIAAFKEPTYDFGRAADLYEKAMRHSGFQFLTFPEAEQKGWI